MRMAFFLGAVTTHLVTPFPIHSLSAMLAMTIGLCVRTGFTWFRESRHQQLASA